MTNEEKINLISKMIGDFWEYNEQEEQKVGATVMVTAIHSVVTFGEDA